MKFTTNTLLIILLSVKTRGMIVDFFTAKDRHGNSIRIDVSDRECTNLPRTWGNKIVSMDTRGSCVQFFEQPFCRGSLTVIQPFHTIHQMDLSLINFANVVKSASPCGPKVADGRYVIQNAADATILTVQNKIGGFASVRTDTPSKLIPKSQQWDVSEGSNSDYTLKPRDHQDNFPVSYDASSLKNGEIIRKTWKLMAVGRGRYIFKSETTQRCLYKTDSRKVEEHDCRIFSPNQEWVFRQILVPETKPAKINAPTGPGLNLNILSKVTHYRPVKRKPSFIPIYLNQTGPKRPRPDEPTPYQIRRKIKRGPRPQSQLQRLPVGLKPPGLRPAIPDRIANNNNFLLLKLPASQAGKKPIVIPDTIPSDKDHDDDDDNDNDKENEPSDEEHDEEEDENDESKKRKRTSLKKLPNSGSKKQKTNLQTNNKLRSTHIEPEEVEYTKIKLDSGSTQKQKFSTSRVLTRLVKSVTSNMSTIGKLWPFKSKKAKTKKKESSLDELEALINSL